MYSIGNRIKFTYKNIEHVGYVIDKCLNSYFVVTDLPRLVSIKEKDVIGFCPREA